MRSHDFRVFGIPAPKGSKKAYVRGGHAVLVESSKAAKPWEQAVHWTARDSGCTAWEGPIDVCITFLMPRVSDTPKKRLDTPHIRKPDIDKLLRCTLDGLTGACFLDDSQVCGLRGEKRYCNPGESPGAEISVCVNLHQAEPS